MTPHRCVSGTTLGAFSAGQIRASRAGRLLVTPEEAPAAGTDNRHRHRHKELAMCTTTLENGPLTCVRTDSHDSGHVYQSHNGSWVQDRHEDGGHG